MKLSELFQPVIAVGTVMAMIIAAFTIFARAEDVRQLDKSLKYHTIEQQRDILENRLEKLLEAYKNKSMGKEALELKKDLEKRLQQKEKELKDLEKK